MVDRNSAPEEFTCIWQSNRVGIITINTEKIWIPVVTWSLYFGKASLYSFRADSILKSDGDFISNWKFPDCVHFFGAWARQAVIETIAVVYEHTKRAHEMCSPIGHNHTKHFLCPIRSRHPVTLNFWKLSGESRYPGALLPLLENFCPSFSPDSTDYPWVSEDGQTGALTTELTGRWYVAHRVSYPQLLWRHQDHLHCGRYSHHLYGSQQILRSIRAFYCHCTLHSQCLFPTTSFLRFLESPPVLKKRKHLCPKLEESTR